VFHLLRDSFDRDNSCRLAEVGNLGNDRAKVRPHVNESFSTLAQPGYEDASQLVVRNHSRDFWMNKGGDAKVDRVPNA
jgi:hypothetical protein